MTTKQAAKLEAFIRKNAKTAQLYIAFRLFDGTYITAHGLTNSGELIDKYNADNRILAF